MTEFDIVSPVVFGCIFVVILLVLLLKLKAKKRRLSEDAAHIEQIEGDVDQLKTKLNQEHTKCNSFKQKAFELNQKFNVVECEKTRLLSQIQNKEFDLAAVQKKLQDAENILASIENVDKEQLTNELNAAREKVAQFGQTKAILEQEKDRLKTKVEDLEEENDDLQDELAKKKQTLQDKVIELENIEREAKKQKGILEETAKSLDDTKLDLSKKQTALTFVQEILNAKEAPAAVSKARHKAIDGIERFLNDTLVGLLSAEESNSQEIEKMEDDFLQWKNLEKKHWLKNKRTVAFVGEFAAGKTSIVNELLLKNDKNAILLPESVKATTAIPTYISNTSGLTSFTFLTPNNKLKQMSESTFKRVDKEVLDNVKGTSSLIKYFVMSYKNNALRDLSILDTPGFDSNDSKDANRTVEVINECDALFWIIDVNKGELNTTSIKTIKENLKRPLFIVINKVDSVSAPNAEACEKKVKQTLDRAEIQYEKIIFFSKKMNADEILKHLISVPKKIKETNAIHVIREKIEYFLNKADVECKMNKDRYTNSQEEGRSANRQFGDAIADLNKKCQEIQNIPSYASHWFSDNKYEMSTNEHGDFINHINDISNISNDKLKELYKKSSHDEKAILCDFENYQKSVQKSQQWQDAKESFEHLVEEYNRG